MIRVSFKPSFVREFSKLEKDLQDEVYYKISLFKNPKNHRTLKVHKLHGKFSACLSFSVNYKFRVVFEYETKNDVVLLAIGDHAIYQ